MTGKADSISDYIRAKDGNRPYLLDTAFAEDASLEMIVQTASVSFPPTSIGRDAIAETLVRRFNQQYENIFTLCIGIRPEILTERFSCQWMVVMSDKQEGALRIGCGRYDWQFRQFDDRIQSLHITIEAMECSSSASVSPIMTWVSGLPYPWCELSVIAEAPPSLPSMDRILMLLQDGSHRQSHLLQR